MFNEKSSSLKAVGKLVVSTAVLLLSACSSGLNGIYTDEQEVVEMKFESGGKVYMSTIGMETELEYKIDGDKVKIIMPQGNWILRMQDDGTLNGPMGVLSKKK